MHEINLKNVDLNLLVTLEALLQEENVTRAAERLGKSQPAASHALGRLRSLFDDPLLVQGQGGMKRTPKAESLLEPLERSLRQVESLIAVEREFDPATTRRTFAVGCPDLLAGFFTDLLGWMGRQAPNANLEIDTPADDEMESALETGRFDVVIAPIPESATTRLRQRRVGSVEWYCLMREGHPALEGGFDRESWVSHPHVMVRKDRGGVSLVDEALRAQGLGRRVGLTIPQFLMGGPAVAASDLIYTAPHMLAVDAVERYPLVARPTPLEVPEVDAAVIWHERWDADEGHRWLRTGIWEALRERWEERPPVRDLSTD